MLEDLDATGVDINVKVFQNISLQSKLFLGKRYVILKKEDDVFQSINLPQAEWEIFVLKMEEVGDKLKIVQDVPNKGVKRRLVFDSPPQAFLYHTDIIKNGEVIYTSLDGYLSEDKARAKGFLWKKNLEKREGGPLEMKLTKVPTKTPSPAQIMRVVLFTNVLKMVEGKAKSMCEGCEFECPGQKDHMGFGCCLAPVEQKVSMFIGHIISELKGLALSQQFDRLRAKMGLNPMFSFQLAQGAIDYLGCKEQMLEMLQTKMMETGVFKHLLTLQKELECWSE